MEKKILHLTLYKVHFDAIAKGDKTSEYRDDKEYWSNRFYKDEKTVHYNEVWFKNGYAKNAPFMRVEWLDCVWHKGTIADPEPYYEIKLGKVLEVKR